jgi:site-specific DNA-methyltransferase (adenine-specific)
MTLLHGDCLEKIPELANRSIRAVITSPPYAEQRKKHYPGWHESEYPATMVKIFDAIRPKLTKDGSILMNIRSHVEDGAVSDYVLRTRLALRDAGWYENEELIWYKPQAPATGSKDRPRRTFENILWFSQTKKPYTNMKAAGHLSSNLGFVGPKQNDEKGQRNLYGGFSERRKSGVARIKDVFIAGVGQNSKGVNHPAMFPPTLVEQLVHTFTKEGDGVLDPFAGSGTTLFVSRFMGRKAYGVEIMIEFVDLIYRRKARINWRKDPPVRIAYGSKFAASAIEMLQGMPDQKMTPSQLKQYQARFDTLMDWEAKDFWRVLDVKEKP